MTILAKTDSGYAEHMAAVEQRLAQQALPETQAMLEARVSVVNQRMPHQRTAALIEQAVRATSNTKRLFWLRREADLVSEAAAPISACRDGCSHCCHINVLLSEAEARVIGKELGIPVAEPAPDAVFIFGDYASPRAPGLLDANRERIMTSHMGDSCPFLSGERCGIYEHRPLACRQQLNMDKDDLLCRLVEDDDTPTVPYLNQLHKQVAQIFVWGHNARLADIREWFPGRPLQIHSY